MRCESCNTPLARGKCERCRELREAHRYLMEAQNNFGVLYRAAIERVRELTDEQHRREQHE